MGSEAISRIWSKPGSTIGIATEAGSLLYQHSIVPLTDTLALYGAFSTLSPGLTDPNVISAIIQAASARPEDSLERTLDFLRAQMGDSGSRTPVASTLADLAQRDDFYANLYALLDARTAGLDYGIIPLAGKKSSEIAALAATESSVRRALEDLSPFAVRQGDQAGFADSRSTLWLAARADMLAALDEGRQADLPFAAGGTSRSVRFEDRTLDLSVASLGASAFDLAQQYVAANGGSQLQGYVDGLQYDGVTVFGSDAGPGEAIEGGAGADGLFGGAGADSLDGGAGDDELDGGAGADILLGGEGDDVLAGEAGADRLEGGSGYDRYVYATSVDADTIADRDGRVFVGGTPLTGGSGEDGSYQSPDGRFSYRFAGDLDAGGTLTIDGQLKVENFRNGDLGIRLGQGFVPDDAAPTSPSGGTLLLGDINYRTVFDPARGISILPDEFGNPTPGMNAGPAPDLEDTYEKFPGTPGATHFVSGGGSDVMQDVLGGDDWLELGTGDDFGWGGSGNDVVEGGPGRDVVAGGIGNDVLYAGAAGSKAADLADDAIAATPDAGGLLSGGSGDDFIYGDAGESLIEGGSGDDHIFAGAGDDWIGADVSVLASAERYRVFPPSNDWVNREVDILWNPFNSLPTYSLGTAAPFGLARQANIDGRPIGVTSSSTDGSDYIDAGAGNDTIFAGGGDDVVLGGGGDDYIDPGTGHDIVQGGAGREYMASWFGDSAGDDFDGGEGDDFLVDLASEGNRIDGGAGNDYVQGGTGTDVLIGGDGDDFIFSFDGDDVVLAGAGNDLVRTGGSGNTFLAGGAGNDRLVAAIQSYGGSATFAWGRGDGNDLGLMLGGSGTLQIGALPGEVSVQYVTGVPSGELVVEDQPEALGSGFRFAFDGGSDSFTLLELPDYFGHSNLQVRYSDGTTLDDADLRALAAAPGASDEPAALAGTSADDVIYGSDGADRFASSGGNDWLVGSAGDDVYEYALGDGFDQIEDSDGSSDTLQIAAGIGTGDVEVFASGPDYILGAGAGGVRIRGGRTRDGAIERIEFADGARWTPADLEARAEILPDNRAPELPTTFGRVSVDPGNPVQVVLPGNAVSDPDRFDAVSLYAVSADGEKLPAWLNFDAASRTLSGTPGLGDVGVHDLLVIAADSGGSASAASLTIAVGPDQPAPETPPAPSAAPVAESPAPAAMDHAPAAQTEPGADLASVPAPMFPSASTPSARDDAFLGEVAPVSAAEPPPFAESADPVFREIEHRLDVLLQTGRHNLGERYAEAIREFEERRLERENAPLPPPPTEEEIEAWNAAMHTWHDRNPGFAETELGGNDATWSMGWGL
ncbi:MAG TPA: putative Ig domain-containing protein, partial [Vicinamibacterales bacterium]|nr:putative Ig domain-containing protein [Vicinamibacterales bacterium]